MVAHFPPNSEYEGMSLDEIGLEMGCEPAEAALRLYEQSDGSYILHSMEDSDVEAIAQWRLMAVCSDGSSLRTTGPLSSGKPHPRSYATNSRYLETFVKERGLVSFEEAIYKMTALGAQDLISRAEVESHEGCMPTYWYSISTTSNNTTRSLIHINTQPAWTTSS